MKKEGKRPSLFINSFRYFIVCRASNMSRKRPAAHADSREQVSSRALPGCPARFHASF